MEKNPQKKIEEFERIVSHQGKIIEYYKKELERYQTYIKIAPVIIVVLDRYGMIEFINFEGVKILGYAHPDELIGKDWFEKCIPPRIQDSIKFIHYKIIEGEIEGIEYYENPVMTKFGKEKIIAWNNSYIKDKKGKIISTVSVGRDITKEKKTGEEVKRIEQQYKIIFEFLPDPVHVINRSYRIILFNPAFKKWSKSLGLPEEVIGKNLFDVFPFLPEKVKEEYEEVFDTGTILITREQTDVNGKIIPTETRKIPVKKENEVYQIITIIRVFCPL